jgi:hypothetical protein
MTTLKLPSRRKIIAYARTRARVMILVLAAAVLLAACSNKSTATTSQGTADITAAQPRNATSALLADLRGIVEVKTGNGQWAQAQSRQTLESGQDIRTGALSNATLTFYDASHIYLAADTEISLNALDARTAGARVIQITQTRGESRHKVTRSDNLESHYSVNTAAGNGSATDAVFTVVTWPDRLSQFWVDEGVISVVNVDSEVVVVAGQTSVSLMGQPPAEPAFRIFGEGKVIQVGTANNGQLIQIGAAGVVNTLPATQVNQNDKVTLCHATGSASNPYVEITVSAAGVANGHSKHAGDIIPAPAAGCPTAAPGAAYAPTTWNIAGQIFHTGVNTAVFGNPQPGDWVRFEGYQQADGSRFADWIMVTGHTFENQFEFVGKVEAISSTTWTISSRLVQVNEFTTIDTGLNVNDNVLVTGSLTADGAFWALRISRMHESGTDFRFVGVLTAINRDVWTISGIQVAVSENSALDGDFVVGHPVVVEGIIQENGTWLATSIDLVTPEGYRFDFMGATQSIDPWVVSGVGFDTAVWTEIDADIAVGNKVRVTGVISADGVWVAERIELLSAEQLTRFHFFGQTRSVNPWNVQGILLTVDERTVIKGNIVVGEMVKVTGWILPDGSWLATEIKHTGLHRGQGCFMISSVVQSLNGEQIILVNGQTIIRSDELELIGDLREASLVHYEFCVNREGMSSVRRIIVLYQDQYQYQIQSSTETQSGKVVVCHVPPGNPKNRHTIEIGQSAVPAHLAHGDTLGPCP